MKRALGHGQTPDILIGNVTCDGALTHVSIQHDVFMFVVQATDDGKTLIVANMFSGEVYTVDPETGIATVIDLGGAVVHGDGLVRLIPV